MFVQFCEPMNSWAFAPIAIFVCMPSAIRMGDVFLMLSELVSIRVKLPQEVDDVCPPQGVPGSVPATYRVFPLNKPVVAAGTGMLVPMVLLSMSSTTTAPAVPWHSGPHS